MHCFSTNVLNFLSIVSLIGKCDNNINYKNTINYNINHQNNTSMNNQMKPDLSIYSITWNTKGEQPKCDLTQLLNINTELKADNNNDLYDIYAIGLQEVPNNWVFSEPWTQAFDKLLSQLSFVRLESIRLLGILLLVYTKRQLRPKFRSIQTQYTRTGFGGFWGNKGGVSVSFIVEGVSVCLVNSHLAAHYEQMEQRIADYNSIIDDQRFTNTQKPTILSHDYAIWLGDLNFRIDDLSGDEIHKIILNARNIYSDNKYERLLEKDQLNRVRREGRAFSEFSESVPTFAPTYKFFVNTDNYDYKSRKPAFTDRVLYRFTKNAYEDLDLELKQIEYKSYPQYKQSDHKPVSALFYLNTKTSIVRSLSKRSTLSVDGQSSDDLFVTFLPITDWKVRKDGKAWYSITPTDENTIKKLSNWDWIGLFKADFMSTDEHISYVWANPEPTRWSPPTQSPNARSSSASSSSSDDSSSQQRPPTREPWFRVTFSDQSLLVADQFRLVYVTQEGDVLGISEPFVISD